MLALCLAELLGIGYFQFYYCAQPVSCTVDDKCYMLQDEFAPMRAHEFHTGDKPDEDRIRIARQVLEDRIARFKMMDEMRDILYYIADKVGLL
jgi:hypothetical protein